MSLLNNNNVIDLSEYPRFRVVMTGNLSEYAINTMTPERLKSFQNLDHNELRRLSREPGYGQKTYGCDFRNLKMFREWDDIDRMVHASGVVLDNDLRIIVENGDGDEIGELTSLAHGLKKNRYANDNEEIVLCANDFLNLNDGDPEEDDVDIGLLEVRDYQPTYVEALFNGFSAFDASHVKFDLGDVGSKPIITGLTYGGHEPDDVGHYRDNDRLPLINLRAARI